MLLDAVNFELTWNFPDIGLKIQIWKLEDEPAILPPLITLLQMPGYDGEIRLEGNLKRLCDLPSLFDSLAKIVSLKLFLGSANVHNDIAIDTLVKLVELLRENKTVHLLELVQMAPIDGFNASNQVFRDLFCELNTQKFLTAFRIGVATAESKKLVGEFVENSNSVQRLTIDIYGAASAPFLVKRLKKNTSLKKRWACVSIRLFEVAM